MLYFTNTYVTFEEIVHTLDNFGKIKIKSINIVFYTTTYEYFRLRGIKVVFIQHIFGFFLQ